MTIYRGYEIVKGNPGVTVYEGDRKTGKPVCHASNEETALDWIDKEKKRQAQEKAK